MVLISNTFAQLSNLILFAEQGERFTVILNGIKQNANPETNVKITGLNADSYKLKVIFQDQKIGDMDKNIFFATKGNEYTYTIKKNNKGVYTLRYVSEVSVMQAPPVSNGQTTIVYTTVPPPANSTVTYTETTTTNVNGNPNGGSVSMGVNVDGVNLNMNVNVNDPNVNTNTTTSYTTTTTTTTTTNGNNTPVNNQPVVYVPGYSGPIGCPYPMSQYDFEGAKNSIVSKNFEDSKLTIAKQIVGANCMLSSQVREIMKLFDFEDTKLQFAKFAYNKTYDIGNYYKLNDAFQFESSIDELNSYINGGH